VFTAAKDLRTKRRLKRSGEETKKMKRNWRKKTRKQFSYFLCPLRISVFQASCIHLLSRVPKGLIQTSCPWNIASHDKRSSIPMPCHPMHNPTVTLTVCCPWLLALHSEVPYTCRDDADTTKKKDYVAWIIFLILGPSKRMVHSTPAQLLWLGFVWCLVAVSN